MARDVLASTPRQSRGHWVDSAPSVCDAYAGGVEGVVLVVSKKASFIPNLIKLLVLVAVAGAIIKRAQQQRGSSTIR